MCRLPFFIVTARCAAQTFPGSVGPLLGKLRNEMDVASDPTASDVQALVGNAATELANEVALDRRNQGTADSAVELATRDAQHLKFVGGCVRALDGCPVNWLASNSGGCSPPADYDGLCGETNFSKFSAAQKEEFAMTCKAAWPCKPCVTDFSNCPAGWAPKGRLCVAPADFSGICSPVVDLSSSSDATKASWSAMCGAKWPCK